MTELKREQFLPAITTTYGSDWRAKIREADDLGITEVAVFPTCLNRVKREEFFSAIAQSQIKSIPFAHIRTDMAYDEIDWLIEKYNTKALNIHPKGEHSHLFNYERYREIIYLENVYQSLDESELNEWAGVCLDFSHLENQRLLHPQEYINLEKILNKYPVGCNHISAIKLQTHIDNKGQAVYAMHSFDELSEFDYLRRYPLTYFSQHIALELENSLADQLKVLDYILKIKNAG